MINSDDLSEWHDQPEWRRKAERSQKNPGVVFTARQKSVAIMAMTVRSTVAGANGQEVLGTVKNKELRFADLDLEPYIDALIAEQDGLCAISGLSLRYHGSEEDKEMLCSLDRIDSDGHYEAGNLQVVCRFINRWKSDGNNSDFCRLVEALRSPAN